MSPQAKVDLGAKAEAMLASWPAPSSDDAAWENRAAKIVAAATNAPRATDAELAACFAKPALDAEPGENESSNISAVSSRSASGVKAMSESNPGSPGSPSSPSVPPASAAVSKRPSLKELAARASQANAAGSPSMRPTAPASLPPPSAEAVSQEKRPSTPAPVAAPAKASIPPPRPLDASKEDSGRVDLNAISQAAAPAAVAAAVDAKPAAAEAVSEDKPAAKEEGAKVKNIADARAKKTKKKGEAAKTNEAAKTDEPVTGTEAAPSAAAAKKADDEGGGGKWAILAALALAAGGFLYFRSKQAPPPPPPVAVVQEKPDTTPIVADQKKIEEPKPASTGLSVDALPAAAPTESAKPVAAKVAAANTVEEVAPPPPQPPEPTAPTALPTATAGGKPGDLSSAMAQAVGGSTEKPVNADDATPAAGKTGSQTIPEQPPQGSVAAAMRGVTPGAKACVAGADEPSHANVTFSSAGTVSNVSVSGWASKNGKADCIKAALKGANVGPFSKPSFTVGVPIRP